MQLKDPHVRFLNRTSRNLSVQLKRRVSPDEVLQAIVDMAIVDEGIYDPEDGRPVAEGRREVVQAAKAGRTLDLSTQALLDRVILGAKGRQ
jgi:hypothetical protein